jgi:hypothetical protein
MEKGNRTYSVEDLMRFKKAPRAEESDCMPGKGISDEEFASFCKTPEYLKRGVTGRITTVDGQELYIDGAGLSPDNPGRTRAEFKARFGYDPKPVWERIHRQKIIVIGGYHGRT